VYEGIQKLEILVTGGCGFIGSHFVNMLIRGEHSTTILDKMTYAADINRLDPLATYEDLYQGDICNVELCERIIKDNAIDTIVNFAAETHVDNSIKDSTQFMHSNVMGVHVLLELVRKYNLRFVQISTDEVYGSIYAGSFEETDRLNPSNPYAATKACADLIMLSYQKTYGLPVMITRSSNIYGPGQFPEKFIPKMIHDAKQGKPLSVYGNGENVRDWLYVKDNCEAIKLVMERGRPGEIYNIAGGNEMTNNQVATIIFEKFMVPIEYVKDRPGHDFRYSINCSKIRDELGWKPSIPFEKGIDETIMGIS
jgi:dTDP-glucose 4,6-dehydratase